MWDRLMDMDPPPPCIARTGLILAALAAYCLGCGPAVALAPLSNRLPSARSVVFDSPWCRLVAETLPDGQPYYMVEAADYVSVVARTVEGRLILVRQHRPVVGHETIELPSGHVDEGETPAEAARRELLEETGMTAKTLDLLGVLAPDVGRLANRIWCYFAGDVTPVEHDIQGEDGITVLEVEEAEALAMAVDGRMEHALNLAVLFLAVSKRRLRWPDVRDPSGDT
jgi:8-oxo-dGTP pyrophosphatase MutT (NUDIX family)